MRLPHQLLLLWNALLILVLLLLATGVLIRIMIYFQILPNAAGWGLGPVALRKSGFAQEPIAQDVSCEARGLPQSKADAAPPWRIVMAAEAWTLFVGPSISMCVAPPVSNEWRLMHIKDDASANAGSRFEPNGNLD
jgi:hypothetical protein